MRSLLASDTLPAIQFAHGLSFNFKSKSLPKPSLFLIVRKQLKLLEITHGDTSTEGNVDFSTKIKTLTIFQVFVVCPASRALPIHRSPFAWPWAVNASVPDTSRDLQVVSHATRAYSQDKSW